MNTFRVNISAPHRRAPSAFTGLLLALVGCGLLLPAAASRVDNLYGAVVELPARSQQLNPAFDDALGVVLMKLTGLPELRNPAARASLFPNSASMVQQYSRLPDNQLRVDFDPVALRTALDRADQPLWGEDRPLVAVWLAVDQGGGRRTILSEGGQGEITGGSRYAAVRADLFATADQYGLPIVLPLADAEDMRRVSVADVWGDFRGPIVTASNRYGADAVLIGRTRSLDLQQQGVRWTLVAGDEQASWQGSLSGGPAYAAEFLAQRLATYANSAGALRVLVTGVSSLDTYGQLRNYFRSLNIVETATVAQVDGNQVEFELIVRGDVARLSRTLDANPRLTVGAERPIEVGANSGRPPDLIYAWSQ